VQESASLPRVSGTGTGQKMDVPIPGRRDIRSDYLFVRRQAGRHQLDPGLRSVNDPFLALVFLQAEKVQEP
jgi:hypothetical protein